MPWKRKIAGGILGLVGFMLSPLSWWNDAFVNLPLALAFAWFVSAFVTRTWKEAVFGPALIVGYWLTNVLGFVLMHVGAEKIMTNKPPQSKRRNLTKDLLVSLGYTLLLVILVKLGVLRAIDDYFPANMQKWRPRAAPTAQQQPAAKAAEGISRQETNRELPSGPARPLRDQ